MCSDISGNNLSGSIPESWSAKTELKSIYVEPGNPQLCTTPPPNSTFQLCVAGDMACRTGQVAFTTHTVTCYAAPPPSGDFPAGGNGSSSDSTSGSTTGGSSFPIAAVAVPVAVVGVAALVGGFVVWRRRQWQQQQQQNAAAYGFPDKAPQARWARSAWAARGRASPHAGIASRLLTF